MDDKFFLRILFESFFAMKKRPKGCSQKLSDDKRKLPKI